MVTTTSGYLNESKNPSLPDPLITLAGKSVKSPEGWRNKRRTEILALFREHVYGYSPTGHFKMGFEIFDEDGAALDGKAVRKQVAIQVTVGEQHLCIDLLIYLPKNVRSTPIPIFTLLNFNGNHTIHTDPAIVIPKSYIEENFLPSGQFRGVNKSRFPVESILAHSIGVATAYCGDIDPDFDDGFKNGVHQLFDPPGKRARNAWGAVGAWAWGLSRIMDFFETEKAIDNTRVAVLGHSRLGKAALWAGAQDERFSIVISNNSGCTGASLARHSKGESIQAINDNFPHWFCENYKQYNNKEDELPVDQHMLIALIAPRPVYVASAQDDHWADPGGEFLSCVYAQPVYQIFNLQGLEPKKMPSVFPPMTAGNIGYHIRKGKHDLTEYDWNCFMDFTTRHWKREFNPNSQPI